MMQRRKFSVADKLGILDRAEVIGVWTVMRVHQLSYKEFVEWKRKYKPGVAGSSLKKIGKQKKA